MLKRDLLKFFIEFKSLFIVDATIGTNVSLSLAI